MNPKLHPIFNRFMAPADDDLGGGGGGGGEKVDRGDDFTPTDDDAPTLKAPGDDEAAAKALADELEAEKVAKAAADAAKAKEGEKEEKDEEGKPKKKDDRIPASRHKEILEKERERREALERELAKYKQGEVIADTNKEITESETELTKLESDYAKHVTDGEAAKAAEVMARIRKLERGIITKQAEVNTAAAEARAVERVRYDTTLDRIEEAYPQLREGDDAYDKAKVAEVIELQRGFQSQGYTPSQALQKAVKYVMPKAETRAQERAVEVEARVDAAEVEKERKKAAAAKAADATGKQPPSTAKVGLDSDKLGGGISAKAVLKMSQDEFAKLDEATLAKMRGDVIA
jgi:hypothetical protein